MTFKETFHIQYNIKGISYRGVCYLDSAARAATKRLF